MQSQSGKIKLYSPGGHEMISRRYRSHQERNDMLIFWSKLYGKQFKFMSYGIVPNISSVITEKIAA